MEGVSSPSDTQWHGMPPAPGPAMATPPTLEAAPPREPAGAWTIGRVGYLVSLAPLGLVVFAFRPDAVPLVAPAVLAVCVARHARWVDVLWWATVVAAAIAAAPREVRDFRSYGLGSPNGCMPPMDSLQVLQREGPVFEAAGGVYAFSFSSLLFALIIGTPALVAPIVRYAVQKRRERQRAKRAAPPTEPVAF